MIDRKSPHNPNVASGQARPPAPIRAMFRIAGLLAPEAVGSYVGRKMFRPRRLGGPAATPHATLGVQKIALPHRDTALNLHAWGSGSRIVLLVHGWEGDIRDMSEFIMPLLRQNFRVLALELPAHGASGASETDVHDAAAAIGAAAENCGPLHSIVAHSLGGAAATVFLSEHSGAARLVLVAPGGDLGQDIRRLSSALALPERASAALSRYVSARYGRSLEECSTARAAKSVHIPALIFHDLADRITPFAEAQEISRSFLQGRLVPTSGLGHRRILKDADVISLTVEFLAGGLLAAADETAVPLNAVA